MPKRIVDGEALWRSDRLAKLPVDMRAEYANLIPLALANGSFECTPRLVWAQVYSYNRPDVTIERVQKILDQLERHGLLVRWQDADKTWGYWVGIEKPGRLPPLSRLQHGHETLGPTPPSQIMASHEVANGSGGFGFGFGLGVRLANGLGSGSGECAPGKPMVSHKAPEESMKRLRDIGFRDSKASAAEHAFAEVLDEGADAEEVIAACQRIFGWTGQGEFAPRLYEVIRRWQEPQHLWERSRRNAGKPKLDLNPPRPDLD